MDLIFQAAAECGGTDVESEYNSTLAPLPEYQAVERTATYYVPDSPPPPKTTSTSTSIGGASSSSGVEHPNTVYIDENGQMYVDGRKTSGGVNSVMTGPNTTVIYAPPATTNPYSAGSGQQHGY